MFLINNLVVILMSYYLLILIIVNYCHYTLHIKQLKTYSPRG